MRSAKWAIAVLVILLLTGCGINLHDWSEAANARQQQSCIYVQGGYGLFMAARIVSATGGVPLETCLTAR